MKVGEFTDSNLHRYEVRAEIFGLAGVQHVVIERLNKDGSRRQQPGPRGDGQIILDPADADSLVVLIGLARRQPPEPAP
jgi:hypothetical protein